MMRHDIFLNAPRNVVFDALTTREGLDGWWGTAIAATPEAGTSVELDHGFEQPLRFEVLECVEGSRVSWRCITDLADPSIPTTEWAGHELTFDLSDAKTDTAFEYLVNRFYPDADRSGITIVHFEQRGWRPEDRWYAFCNGAWGATLNDKLLPWCEAQAGTASR